MQRLNTNLDADNATVKHISKRLHGYIVNQDVYIPMSLRGSDLKSLAMEGSVQESIKLTKLVLLAACESPQRESVIQGLMSLTESAQTEVMDVLRESRPLSESENSNSEQNSSPIDDGRERGPAGDMDLLHEEQMGKIQAENHQLHLENQDLIKECQVCNDKLEEIRQSYADLQSRLAKAEEQIGGSSVPGGAGGSGVKFLQTKIKSQEELIANQESQAAALEDSLRSVQKKLDKSITASEKAQQYKDERDELAIERDDLRRKANTLDKYKQKLEASAALEKENVETRKEVEELREKFSIADQERQRLSGLAIAVDEYERTLPRIEQDAHDLRNMKKQLEFDNAVLVQRCETVEEERDEDRKTIKGLKSRLHGFDIDASSVVSQSNDDLNGELTDGDKAREAVEHNIRLEHENGELRSAVIELEAKIDPLQRLLDNANRRLSDFDRRNTDAEKSRQESRLTTTHGNTHANKRRSSRLSSVSNANDIVSVEAFQSIEGQLIEEKQLRNKAELDLAALREARDDGMFASVLVEEVQQTITNDEIGLDSERGLANEANKAFDEELASALEAIKAATQKEAESDSDKQVLDQHISSLADKVAGSRARLLKQTEVTLSPRISTSIYSSSSTEEPVEPSRFSVASSSLFFRKRHSSASRVGCNSRPGIIGAREARSVRG